MKKLILLTGIVLSACHKSPSPAPVSRTTSPAPVTTSTNTLMTATTCSLVGVWVLDSTVQYSNNSHLLTTLPSPTAGTDYTFTISSAPYSTIVPNYPSSNVMVYSFQSTTTGHTYANWEYDQSIYNSTGLLYIVLLQIDGYIISLTSTSLVLAGSTTAPTSVKNGAYYHLHR